MAKNGAGAPRGNRNAVKGRPWREAINRAIDLDDRNRLDKAAEMLLSAAANGDMDAIKELGNRLDGRPHQAVEMTFTDSVATRLSEADERLATWRAARATEEQDDYETPEWLQ